MSREVSESHDRSSRPLRRNATEPGTAKRIPSGRRGALATRLLEAVVAVAVLATSGWGWYLNGVAEASLQRTDAIPIDGNSESANVGEAMNRLLVGNDSRADLTDEQHALLNAGTDSGTNTDTVILMHVPADGSKPSFVSFPRDSYVQIPGYGRDKLNAAYAYGRQNAPAGASEKEKAAQGPSCWCRPSAGSPGCRSTTTPRSTCGASSS